MVATRTEAVHRHAEGLDIQAAGDHSASSLAEPRSRPPRSCASPFRQSPRPPSSSPAQCWPAAASLAYAAAGSSGLMALADALELPGTFGIPRDRIEILIAGGDDGLPDTAGGPEDDEAQAARDVAKAGIGKGDCLIALSASGTTPYAVTALEGGQGRAVPRPSASPTMRARRCLRMAEIAILLPTPPEVIAGSTRMGAAPRRRSRST